MEKFSIKLNTGIIIEYSVLDYTKESALIKTQGNTFLLIKFNSLKSMWEHYKLDIEEYQEYYLDSKDLQWLISCCRSMLNPTKIRWILKIIEAFESLYEKETKLKELYEEIENTCSSLALSHDSVDIDGIKDWFEKYDKIKSEK